MGNAALSERLVQQITATYGGEINAVAGASYLSMRAQSCYRAAHRGHSQPVCGGERCIDV
jgi:hypothetical protein